MSTFHRHDEERFNTYGECFQCTILTLEKELAAAYGRVGDWQDRVMTLESDLKAATEIATIVQQENASLRERLAEDNEVCVCGCPTDEHESYGEDGEGCGNDDHECVRTCIAVRGIVRSLREQLAKAQVIHERNGWLNTEVSRLAERLASCEKIAESRKNNWHKASEKLAEAQKLTTTIGVSLSVERYNELIQCENGLQTIADDAALACKDLGDIAEKRKHENEQLREQLVDAHKAGESANQDVQDCRKLFDKYQNDLKQLREQLALQVQEIATLKVQRDINYEQWKLVNKEWTNAREQLALAKEDVDTQFNCAEAAEKQVFTLTAKLAEAEKDRQYAREGWQNEANLNTKNERELRARLKIATEALETAQSALHHCDIRHKKCTCSAEAEVEIKDVLAKLGELKP
jgi:hypothetical protein